MYYKVQHIVNDTTYILFLNTFVMLGFPQSRKQASCLKIVFKWVTVLLWMPKKKTHQQQLYLSYTYPKLPHTVQ